MGQSGIVVGVVVVYYTLRGKSGFNAITNITNNLYRYLYFI